MLPQPGQLLDAAAVKDLHPLLLGQGGQGSGGNLLHRLAHIAAQLGQGHRLAVAVAGHHPVPGGQHLFGGVPEGAVQVKDNACFHTFTHPSLIVSLKKILFFRITHFCRKIYEKIS